MTGSLDDDDLTGRDIIAEAGTGCDWHRVVPFHGTPTVGSGETIALGKRYSNDEVGIEVLCVAPGEGPLTFEGAELTQKQATALPASD